MRARLVDRIPFAKIVIVLAITFGVSLGLCGLTLVLSVDGKGNTSFSVGLGVLEVVAMALSAIGMVVTGIAWVILALASRRRRKAIQSDTLPAENDETNQTIEQ